MINTFTEEEKKVESEPEGIDSIPEDEDFGDYNEFNRA